MTEGSVEVRVGNDAVTLNAGDALIIPANSPHRLANVGASDAEWLLIAPAGVGFFHGKRRAGRPALGAIKSPTVVHSGAFR